MKKRTAFVSLCLFLLTAVLVYFPLSAAAQQPEADSAVSPTEGITESAPAPSVERVGYFDEYGNFVVYDDYDSLSADDGYGEDDYSAEDDWYGEDDYDSSPGTLRTDGKSLTVSGVAGSIVSFIYSLITRSSYKNAGAGRTYSLDANTKLALGTSRDVKIDSRVSVNRNFYSRN